MTRVRLLTSAVIGMGVLILIGLVALVIGIVNKAGNSDDQTSRTQQASAARSVKAVGPAMALRQDPVSLGLPAGAEVLRMTAVQDGLAILIKQPGGGLVIYVVPTRKKAPPFRINVTQ